VTTGALLAAAAAVLLWPDRRTERRRRLGDGPSPDLRPFRLDGAHLPALAAGTAAVGGALLSTWLVALLAAVVAAVAARTWQARQRAHRHGVALLCLTEGLAALAAELRSGRPLSAATDAAVAACGDADCGRALAGAVRAPDARVGAVEDAGIGGTLERISAAVRLSTRTGCSLAGVLGAVEDDLRARRRAEEELRSAVAGPGASALVLAGLPVLGLAMGSGVGAHPWRVLTTTGTGQLLLVAGVALELTGLAWSRRLVQRAVR
jgi:tight adherence protein B